MTARRRITRIMNEEAMLVFAEQCARKLHGGEVLLLSGPLGAGKTVFVRGLAKGLGVHNRITSPTFVLMRVYRAASRQPQAVSRRKCPRCRKLGACSCQLVAWFVHVDAYRVRSARDLEAIGLLEWIGRPDTIIAIEWGVRVKKIIRRVPYRIITIGVRAGDARSVTVTPRRRTLPRRS
ncbi:MAG: tRNA (adenosine(37)-N6)-threonylcarbamoyltransferase complex ATPase subunit type 1 TsaE [bacterium]|nr:tRNA (adenosine(37)-N6)-threonylcarbamoyltransferase complex ATPase subunit type 1 TsaE [bacterium]